MKATRWMFQTIAWGLATVCVLTGLGCEKPKPEASATASGHQVNNAACYQGAIWFLESQGELCESGKVSAGTRLVRLKVGADQTLEVLDAIAPIEPWLVAGEDRLWILSAGHVGYWQDGKVEMTELPEPLEDVSRPFLYRGRPALIASQPPGYRLMVWEDQAWQSQERLRMKLPRESDDCTGEYLQAFECNGDVHVFCQAPLRAPVYYHKGLPLADAEQNWQKVVDAMGNWKAACLSGQPAIFHHADRDGPMVVGHIRRDQTWEEFFTRPVGLDIGLGICPTGNGEDFVLLRRILPLELRIIGVESGEPVWGYKGGGQSNLVELLAGNGDN